MSDFLTLPKMLKQGELKVACLDFDDTLFSWLDVEPTVTLKWNNTFLQGRNYYEEADDMVVPVDFMQRFCAELYNKGTPMFCLTRGSTSLPLKAKQGMVDKYYAGLFEDVIICSNLSCKIDVMNTIAEVYNLKPTELLLVDDHPDTCIMAMDKGYYATTPIAIYQVMCNDRFKVF